MRTLFWKEWHEQSWKLAMGCVLFTAMTVIGLHTRLFADQSVMLWLCTVGLMILPMLAAAGLIAPERAEGTLELLLALPINPWRILLTKTATGILLTAMPLIISALAALMLAANREVDTAWIIALYTQAVVAALGLLFWMTAATAKLPSESRAGLVAAGLLVIWVIATTGLCRPSVPQLALSASPLSVLPLWYADNIPGWIAGATAAFQAAFACLLWFYTLRVFSREVT